MKARRELSGRVEEAGRASEDGVRAKNALMQQVRNLGVEMEATKVGEIIWIFVEL